MLKEVAVKIVILVLLGALLGLAKLGGNPALQPHTGCRLPHRVVEGALMPAAMRPC